MNNRLTSYQLQDFAEEDGNSVFSDPDYVVASPLLLVPPNVIVHSIRKSERCLITMVGYSLSAVRRLGEYLLLCNQRHSRACHRHHPGTCSR